MCGVTGLFDSRGERPFDRALVTRMNDSQVHRGPDESGIFLEPGIALAHRRSPAPLVSGLVAALLAGDG